MAFHLEYYRAFYYAATYGSVTKAANALYLTQSAVSQSIKKLEAECSCPLFQRGAHGLSLTHEGTVLFHHVQQAFQLFDQGEHLVAQLVNYEAGELRIGATETAFYQALIPHLVNFRREHPKVRFQITSHNTPDLCRALMEGVVDVALLVTPLPEKCDFTVIPLEDFQDVFIAGEAFAELREREVCLSELERYPLARVDTQSSAGQYLDRWMLQYNRTMEPDFRVQTSSLIIPLVESGLAVGIIPEPFYRMYVQDTRNRQIFRLRLREQIPSRTICLAVNRQHPGSALCNSFINAFRTNP